MPGGRHIPAKLFSTVCLLRGEEALESSSASVELQCGCERGGLGLGVFVWQCCFHCMDSVEQHCHSGAFSHPEPNPWGCRAARPGRVPFQRAGGRRRWETLVQPHQCSAGLPSCSQGLHMVLMKGHSSRGKFSALEVCLWAKFTLTAIPGGVSVAQRVLQSILQICMVTGG